MLSKIDPSFYTGFCTIPNVGMVLLLAVDIEQNINVISWYLVILFKDFSFFLANIFLFDGTYIYVDFSYLKNFIISVFSVYAYNRKLFFFFPVWDPAL